MRISDEGVALVKKHEGLRLKSYLCPAGKWTVGYGHTRSAEPGMMISEGFALQLLMVDLEAAEACVNRQELNLTQRQFDALVCFVFNIGCAAFSNSILLKRIKRGATVDEIREQWMRWVHGGGKILPGLVKRREEEWRLYAG